MRVPVLLAVIALLSTRAVADDMWTAMYEKQLAEARRGNADAQFSVAGMYKNGQGVTSDREKAAYWYAKAAEQSHARAKAAVRLMQANKRKFDKAVIAAGNNEAAAEYKLASMFESGKGTDIDLDQALRWYRSAAEKGHAKAQYNLARIIHDNRKSSADGKTAFRWFLSSAQQGYSPAQFFVGEIYLEGRDVQRNVREALAWYEKAAEGGYGPAYKGINKAEAALGRDEKRASRAKEEALVDAMLQAEEEYARAVSRIEVTSSGKTRPAGITRKAPITSDSIKTIILNGNWVRGKAPAVFLPSDVNTCNDETARVVCSSQDLNPAGDGGGRYRVKSIITSIEANGSFTVMFRRLELGNVADTDWTDMDQKDSAPDGGWSAAMNLQCRLQKGLSISCENSFGKTTEFRRSSRSAAGRKGTPQG